MNEISLCDTGYVAVVGRTGRRADSGQGRSRCDAQSGPVIKHGVVVQPQSIPRLRSVSDHTGRFQAAAGAVSVRLRVAHVGPVAARQRGSKDRLRRNIAATRLHPRQLRQRLARALQAPEYLVVSVLAPSVTSTQS